MSLQWFEVQQYLKRVQVARQNGVLPHPQKGEALLKMLACGICGADIRIVTGNKASSGSSERYITPGHEGVGRILETGNQASNLTPGDCVVVLPHTHIPSLCNLATSGINPACIGNGHTLHMGWEIDGCFSDFMLVPTVNLARVEQKYVQMARKEAPELGESIFALVEPMLCTLSAYELIEQHAHMLLQRDFTPGRALVIGCGPIGILHSLILLSRGFEVWLMDTVQKRVELARWCLNNQGYIFDPDKSAGEFDLVMSTASSSQAIRSGERLVRQGGILYLFAGLNTADRSAMDHENTFFYERLHRTARGVLTTTRLTDENKLLLYLGHSGYFERLLPQAIAAVALHAQALDRAITGIIPGLASSQILSRLPGSLNWATTDGAPAIVSVLEGTDLREQHCKLLMVPGNQVRQDAPITQSMPLEVKSLAGRY